MIIKQISIFMENTTGRLADVTALLAEAGINMRAMSIADTADFGILRMVVDKPDEECDDGNFVPLDGCSPLCLTYEIAR